MKYYFQAEAPVTIANPDAIAPGLMVFSSSEIKRIKVEVNTQLPAAMVELLKQQVSDAVGVSVELVSTEN